MPDKREELILSALRELDRAKTELGFIDLYRNAVKGRIEKTGKMLKELNEK
jgi:hypothetical protein